MQAEEQADFQELGGSVMSLDTSRETARLLAMLTASGSSKVSHCHRFDGSKNWPSRRKFAFKEISLALLFRVAPFVAQMMIA